MVLSAFVGDVGRVGIEANMITSPTWALEGRTFATATGTARERGAYRWKRSGPTE
jgi:hypothetical protein